MKVRKAVIPAAGFGTRFLPQTKAMPKEMLPIVDKPIIQYVVEELVEAGIEQIILVTGWHKRAIEDHFDRHFELEAKLEKSGKLDKLEEIRRISNLAEFIYVRQKEARGNGDAILTAESAVGDEPFVVLWGDDFIDAEPSRTKQMLTAFEKYQAPILSAVKTDDPEAPKKYAYAAGKDDGNGVLEVSSIIEKPGVGRAPSPFAIVSGFLFTPDIFGALREAAQTVPEGKELVYVDGLNVLLSQGKKVYALEIENGKYYDCGTKLGYLETIVEMALKHKDLNGEFREYLKGLKL
ncbi:MAG: UTP--glucose-1-phosphate uridylyltransferase [bacterium]|nr:UTP--glucose-1-phosphate uridylyltransferase [bacterium]